MSRLPTWVVGAAAIGGGLMGCASRSAELNQRFVETGELAAAPASGEDFVPPESEGWQAVDVVETDAKPPKPIYHLGPGDLIEVSAWRLEDFTRDYRVSPDGYITLPLYGDVEVWHLTRDEAAERIAHVLAQGYLDPKVAVIPKEFVNARAYLLGRIKNPGAIDVTATTNLLAALSLGGGIPSSQDERIPMERCSVIRGADTFIDIDLQRLLGGDLTLNIDILPGDVIYVQEAFRGNVTVLGDVQTPGVYPLVRRERLADLLGRAGGLSLDADCNEVILLRGDAKHPYLRSIDVEALLEEGVLENNPELMDGDIIFVPKRFLGKFNYVISRVTPSVSAILLGASAGALIDSASK